LERDFPAPVDSSEEVDLDNIECNLRRDLKPKPPKYATSEFLTLRKSES
jgi:hypothetical protein